MEQGKEWDGRGIIVINKCPNCNEVNVVWGEVFCRYYIKCPSCGCRSKYGLNTATQNGLKAAVEHWNNNDVVLPSA